MLQIEIKEYDPRWPEVFAIERERLATALGVFAADIQHIGSTSVAIPTRLTSMRSSSATWLGLFTPTTVHIKMGRLGSLRTPLPVPVRVVKMPKLMGFACNRSCRSRVPATPKGRPAPRGTEKYSGRRRDQV